MALGTDLVLTLGHSTRALSDFLALLEANAVGVLADVRTAPGSRRHPHFDRVPLEASLAPHGIAYWHVPALGGLRLPAPDSSNDGLEERAFRGFADHMGTAAFAAALEELIARSRMATLALMCAEALPERCHRSLIADALVARGVRVEHILGAGMGRRAHTLTPGARLDGERVRYPAIAPRLPGVP
jgi:uncharacterized protein (DUF488 family)